MSKNGGMWLDMKDYIRFQARAGLKVTKGDTRNLKY